MGVMVVGAALVIGLWIIASFALKPSWVGIAILAPTGTLLAFRFPGVVLAAFLLIPFYKGIIDSVFPLDITPILAVMCFAVALPGFLYGVQQGNHLFPTAFLFWTSALGLIIIGTVIAPDTTFAGTLALEFLLLVYLPLLLCIRVGTDKRLLDQFLISLLTFSMLVTFMSLTMLVTFGSGQRVSVFGSNTIATGQAALFGPLIGASFSAILPNRARLVGMFMIPLALIAIIASGSRGPVFIGLLTVMLVVLIQSRHAVRNAMFATIGAVLAIAALRSRILMDFLPAASVERIKVLIDALLQWDLSMVDASTAARISLFEQAVSMFADKPFMGYGTGGFEWQMARLTEFDIYFAPHNLYLQVASDFGLVGLSFISLFILCVLWNGLQRRRDPRGMAVLSLVIFSLLYGLIDLDLYTSRWFWGFLIILLAYPSTHEMAQPRKRRKLE